jgi:ABC-type transport system substrate-binding protein
VEAELTALRALIVASMIGGLARAETRPRYAGTLDASLLGAPASLDPLLAQSHAELTVAHLLYDTLYCVEADGIAQPHLALAAPAIENNGHTARVALRHGVRFHDGSELTAKDVALSLERARKGAGRWALAAVASVRADGDLVELALRAPVPDLATLLSLPQTSITKGGAAPGERALGSGPFSLVSFDATGHQLVLQAFDQHFAGRPFLDRLVLRWYDTADGEARRFESGDAQLSERRETQFSGAQPVFRADDVEGPAALLLYVAFGRGANIAVTSDRGFHRVVDTALARGSLATISSGERVVPTKLPVPVEAGVPGLDAAGARDDLSAAQAALADAAKRVPALDAQHLSQLQLEILVEATRPDDKEIGARVVDALDAIGIHARVSPVTARELRDRLASGRYDLAIDQLAEPVTAAAAWWAAAFAAGGDDWAERQLATGRIDSGAAQKTFADHLPIVPLAFRSVHVWHRTDVRGFGFDATGRIGFADLFLFGEPARTKGKP